MKQLITELFSVVHSFIESLPCDGYCKKQMNTQIEACLVRDSWANREMDRLAHGWDPDDEQACREKAKGAFSQPAKLMTKECFLWI